MGKQTRLWFQGLEQDSVIARIGLAVIVFVARDLRGISSGNAVQRMTCSEAAAARSRCRQSKH